nr:CyP-40=40-kDa cyclophilin-related protein [cattle, brain, Peptide Partial, 8 aa] [Bos taurus]
NIGNTFFK